MNQSNLKGYCDTDAGQYRFYSNVKLSKYRRKTANSSREIL